MGILSRIGRRKAAVEDGDGANYKKADLGMKNQFYYNEELNMWVERGKEAEARAEKKKLSAPPPSIQPVNPVDSVEKPPAKVPLLRPRGGLNTRYVDPLATTPASSTNSLQALVPGRNAAAGAKPFLPGIPGAAGMPRAPSPGLGSGFFMPSPAPSTAASETAAAEGTESEAGNMVGTDGPPSSGPPSGFGAASLAAAGEAGGKSITANGGPPSFFMPQVPSQQPQRETEPMEATCFSSTGDEQKEQQQPEGMPRSASADTSGGYEATSNGGPYANGTTFEGLNGPSGFSREDSASSSTVESRSLSAARNVPSFAHWKPDGSFDKQLGQVPSTSRDAGTWLLAVDGQHNQQQLQPCAEQDPEGAGGLEGGTLDAEGGTGGLNGHGLAEHHGKEGDMGGEMYVGGGRLGTYDQEGAGEGTLASAAQPAAGTGADGDAGVGESSSLPQLYEQWEQYYAQWGGYEQYQQGYYQQYGQYDANAPVPRAAVAGPAEGQAVPEGGDGTASGTAVAVVGDSGASATWQQNQQQHNDVGHANSGLDLQHQRHEQAHLVQEVSGTDIGAALPHLTLPAINTATTSATTSEQADDWTATHQLQQLQPGNGRHSGGPGAVGTSSHFGGLSPLSAAAGAGAGAGAAFGAPGPLGEDTHAYPPGRVSPANGRPRCSSTGAVVASPGPRSPSGGDSTLMKISSLPARGHQGWGETGQVTVTSPVGVPAFQMQGAGLGSGNMYSDGAMGAQQQQQQAAETPHALFIPPPVRSKSINQQLLPSSPHATARAFFIPEGGPGAQQKTGRGSLGSPGCGSRTGEPFQQHNNNQQQQHFFGPGVHSSEGSPRHNQQQGLGGGCRSPRPCSPLARSTSSQAPSQSYLLPSAAAGGVAAAGGFFIPGAAAAATGAADATQGYRRPLDGFGALAGAAAGGGSMAQANGFISPTRSGSLNRRGSLGPIPVPFGSFDQVAAMPDGAMFMERDSDEGQGVMPSSPVMGLSMSWQDPRTATHPYDRFIKEQLKKVDWKKSPFKQPGKLSKLMPWEEWEREQRKRSAEGNGDVHPQDSFWYQQMKFRKRLPASVVARPTMSAPAIMALNQPGAAAHAANAAPTGAIVTPTGAQHHHDHQYQQQQQSAGTNSYMGGQAASAPPKQAGWGRSSLSENAGFNFAIAPSPADSTPTPESKWRPVAEWEGMSPGVSGSGAATAAARAIDAAGVVAAEVGGVKMEMDDGAGQAAAATVLAAPEESAAVATAVAGDGEGVAVGVLVVAESGASEQQEQQYRAGAAVSYEEQQQQYAAWYAMLGAEHYQYYVDWYAQSYGMGGQDTWAPEQLEAFNGWYGSMCWQQFQQQYGYDQQQQQQAQPEEQGRQLAEGQEHPSLQEGQDQAQQHNEQMEMQKPEEEEKAVSLAAAATAVEGGSEHVSATAGAVAEPVVVRGRMSEEVREIGQMVHELREEVSQHSLEQQDGAAAAAPQEQQPEHGVLLGDGMQGDGWQKELEGLDGWGSELQLGSEFQKVQQVKTPVGAVAQGADSDAEPKAVAVVELAAVAAAPGAPAVAEAGDVRDWGGSCRVSESSGWGSQPSTAKVAEKACKQIMATALERVLAGVALEGVEGVWGEVEQMVGESTDGMGVGAAEEEQSQLVASSVADGEGKGVVVHGNGCLERAEVGQDQEQVQTGGKASPVYPEEWLKLRNHLITIESNSIPVENFDVYKDGLLQYGDYVLANMVLQNTKPEQQQQQSGRAVTGDGSAGGAMVSEVTSSRRVADGDVRSDDEEDEIYEAFAMSRLRLEMQDAFFSRLGVDMGQIMGHRAVE